MMRSIRFERRLATLAVVTGLLVAAAPASATQVQSPKDQLSGIHRAAGAGTANIASDGIGALYDIGGQAGAAPPRTNTTQARIYWESEEAILHVLSPLAIHGQSRPGVAS